MNKVKKRCSKCGGIVDKCDNSGCQHILENKKIDMNHICYTTYMGKNIHVCDEECLVSILISKKIAQYTHIEKENKK